MMRGDYYPGRKTIVAMAEELYAGGWTHCPRHSLDPNTFSTGWHCMHAVAHTLENKAQTTMTPPGTGEM